MEEAVRAEGRFHHSAIVKEAFEKQAVRHFPTYMPPYSPHVNAVEYCFAAWAKYVNRHEKRHEESLLKLVEEAIQAATIENCAGYMREVTRYVILCFTGAPLRYAPPRLME